MPRLAYLPILFEIERDVVSSLKPAKNCAFPVLKYLPTSLHMILIYALEFLS